MHIIYLGGGSVRNKDWIEKVKSEFDKFSDGQILYYSHWDTGGKNLNFEVESQKLAKLVKDKDEYFVFAKSIGSILALKNIYDKNISPQKLIICDHPYNLAKELNLPIDDYLKSLTVPTMFVQNECDPLFSYLELEKVLKENNPSDYHLIKNSGNNTHDYNDYEQLMELTKIYFGDEDKQIHLEKIYKTLDIVAKKLNSLNIKWLLGASGALMVHEVKIVPWDLDILTTPENIGMLKNEFKDNFVSEDDDGLLLKIGGIEVEIINHKDLGSPTPKLFQNNLIPVNTLENELYYYQQRPGKENTIRLIKEKLLTKAEKTIKKGIKSKSPKLIVLMGLPGSGKSYVSSYLHEKYGFTVLSGENITFALFNKVDCTGAQYSLSYDILRQLATTLISQGYSVVIDGTNLKYIFRQQIYNEVSCPDTTLLYLKVSDKIALNRIFQRGVDFNDSKNIKSSISPDVFNKFKNQLEEPLPSENSATLISDDNLLTEIDSIFGVK